MPELTTPGSYELRGMQGQHHKGETLFGWLSFVLSDLNEVIIDGNKHTRREIIVTTRSFTLLLEAVQAQLVVRNVPLHVNHFLHIAAAGYTHVRHNNLI